jgi:putative restriction endonuclease
MQQRLHQSRFRELVLHAYGERCAVCQLRHRELLDAAHILPDHDPRGVPAITNGLSLCRLHHAAFDSYIIGVSPDLIVEVRQDVLDESDGPMLRHGLQGVNGQKLAVPGRRDERPDREFLAERYQLFRRAV